MRISYIWASEFKGKKNYSVNLSSDYQYNFDIKLSREKKKELPDKFFGENISDLCGLLGINASGKTSTLELICLTLKSSTSIRSRFLVIYEYNQELFIYDSSGIKVKASFTLKHTDTLEHFKKLDVIYFSNVFDQNYMNLGKDVIDLSINHTMDPRYYAKKKSISSCKIEDEINFIDSNKFKETSITLPQRICFKLPKGLKDSFKEHQRYGIYAGSLLELKRLFTSEIRNSRHKDPQLKISLIIKTNFIFSLFNRCINNQEGVEKLDAIIMHSIAQSENIDTLIQLISDNLNQSDIQFDFGVNLPPINEIINYIILNLDKILPSLNFKLDHSIKSDRYVFELDFDESYIWQLRTIIYFISDIRQSSISWSGISSGQKAYLNMFSKIWNVLDNLYMSNQKNDNIIICIDEGDLYLHPEWQIGFLEKIVTLLPNISGSNVQLIITTHSPLLVSDLPQQCIQVLGNNQPPNFQTFGANLYDIYDISFGLRSQRTGTLSSKYIDDILEVLDQNSLSENDMEKLKDSLLIIGDELILHHINKKLGEL